MGLFYIYKIFKKVDERGFFSDGRHFLGGEI